MMSILLNSLLTLCKLLTFFSCLVASFYCTGQKKPSVDTLYSVYQQNGIQSVKPTYKALNPEHYDVGWFQLITLGQRIKGSGDNKGALDVFKMNTELFPGSSLPFFNYGELINEMGDRDAAMEAYHRGLENLEKNTTISPAQKYFFTISGKWGLQKIEHLNLTDEAELSHYNYHGGAIAGWWDTENILRFKNQQGMKGIHYRSFDIYNTPVPKHVGEIFIKEKEPDVTSIFNGWTYLERIESGDIVALNDLWDSEGLDKIFPKSIEKAVTYQGKKYLIPQAFQFNPIYYRKSIFDSLSLSPPKSWEELLSLCDKIHNAGMTPFTISAKGWPPPVARWFTILNLRLNGFDFHHNLMNGHEEWTDNRVKNVFIHWKQLFDHHAFAEGSENNNWSAGSTEFYSGKAVMYNIGEWIFENPNKNQLLDDIDFFTIPTLNKNVASAEIFHLYGTMLLKPGQGNKQAKEFLKFVASKESQGHNHTMLETRTPSNMELYDQLSPLQKKQYDYIREVEHLVPLFEFSPQPEFIEFALGQFLDFWADQSDIDKILNELENKRRSVFNGKSQQN